MMRRDLVGFPKSFMLLMNLLEGISIVRLVLIMLLHSWTTYCNALLDVYLFLEEFSNVSLPLTLTVIFVLCKLIPRDN